MECKQARPKKIVKLVLYKSLALSILNSFKCPLLTRSWDHALPNLLQKKELITFFTLGCQKCNVLSLEKEFTLWKLINKHTNKKTLGH